MTERRYNFALAFVTAPALCAAIAACDAIAGLGAPPDIVSADSGPGPTEDAGPEAALESGSNDAGGDGMIDEDVGPVDTPHVRGALDSTFGSAGIATLAGSADIGFHGLVVEPSGAIAYCGAVNQPDEAFLLVGRVTPHGAPDTTFAYTGRYTTAQPGYWDEECTALALVPGGGLAVTGFTDIDANHMMYEARFTETGIPDTTFGSGSGFVAIVDDNVDSKATSLLVQPDRKSILAGFQGPAAAIVRLSADGSPDPTFDPNPTDAAPFGVNTFNVAGAGQIIDMARFGNDKIFASLQSDAFVVVRIGSDGSVDPDYGTGGKASLVLPAVLASGSADIVVQPDGSVVCAGSTAATIELTRFTPSGQLDPSFGTAGRTSIPSALTAIALARLPDGGFALALADQGSSVGIARFTAGGVLDKAFGHGGFTTITANVGGAAALTVDAMGRIVLAIGTDTSVLIARFWP